MNALYLTLIPIIGAFVIYMAGSKNAKYLALFFSLAILGFGLSTLLSFNPEGGLQGVWSMPWLPKAGLYLAFGIDGISILPILLATLITPFIVITTFDKKLYREELFYALIILAQGLMIGSFTALDSFLFYFFFEASLVPVIFISAIWGGANRIKATLKFFIYTVFGSLFMLFALIFLYGETPGAHSGLIADFHKLELSSTVQAVLFACFFIAFAIKTPVFPFHTWQPDAYTEAPATGTMLMSGIMLKMGLYGFIRFLLPITPLAVSEYGHIAIILAVTGIIYGSLAAVRQGHAKRLLAYSSFAHVGLIAAGILVFSKDGLSGSLFHMFSHGINVVGLFFVVEIIASRTGTFELDKLGGITSQARWLSITFVVLMLGSVALPLTNGFVGEFLLLFGLYQYNPLIGFFAGTTIILGAVYMLRLFQKTMLGNAGSHVKNFADLSATEKWVLIPLAILVVTLGVYPEPLMKLTEPAVKQLIETHYLGR